MSPWGRHLNELAVSKTGGLFCCRRERPVSWTSSPEPIGSHRLSRGATVMQKGVIGGAPFNFMNGNHKEKTVVILNGLENLENCSIY